MSCRKGSVEGAPGDPDIQRVGGEEDQMGVTCKDAWRGEGRSLGKWQEGRPGWGGSPRGWGSSGWGASEVTGNFGESNVSWGHAE